MERNALRFLWVTVISIGLFGCLALGPFAQDTSAIEGQEFRKMARKAADLEPWAWEPLFNDVVSESSGPMQLGKMAELLKYSGGRDYACAHAIDLIAHIQHEPARHEVLDLFFYSQGENLNKACGTRICGDRAGPIETYIISLAERPASDAKADKRESIVLDSMEFLFNYYECTSEWRFMSALLSLLYQQRLETEQAGLILMSINRALKERPNTPENMRIAQNKLEKMDSKDISPELRAALKCAIQDLKKRT